MSNPPEPRLRLASEPDRKSDSAVGSNERTNERTDASDPNGGRSGASSRRARAYDEIDGMVPIGKVVDERQLWRTDKRHTVLRIGEREPIPDYVRAAIWYRDAGKCADCDPEYPSGDPLHLDHIEPWSAGGPDTSDNLRLLCERHNVKRSNYIDYARPKRPVTWWCSRCYDLDKHAWAYYGSYVECPQHGMGYRSSTTQCRVGRAYLRAREQGAEPPTWHQRPMLTQFPHIAYCAHCDAPGMTGVLL